MQLQIGNKIRALRRARGITQEQLAEQIGISFQAVSKWENNIALPDITLAPALARYFGITLDALFDYDLRETGEKVEAICDAAYRYRQSDPGRSRAILEEGLQSFPGNDTLLNNLLYTIDNETDADRTIAIALPLIDSTPHDDVKYDALRLLAEAYRAKGDLAAAEAAIEQIPEIYFSRLSVTAAVLTGEKALLAAQKEKWIAFEDLLRMMEIISAQHEAEGKRADALAEAERALALLRTMEGDRPGALTQRYAPQLEARIAELRTN